MPAAQEDVRRMPAIRGDKIGDHAAEIFVTRYLDQADLPVRDEPQKDVPRPQGRRALLGATAAQFRCIDTANANRHADDLAGPDPGINLQRVAIDNRRDVGCDRAGNRLAPG